MYFEVLGQCLGILGPYTLVNGTHVYPQYACWDDFHVIAAIVPHKVAQKYEDQGIVEEREKMLNEIAAVARLQWAEAATRT